MPNNKRWQSFSGEEVLVGDLEFQSGARQQAEGSLSSDIWQNGIIKDPTGISNFQITVDSTTNTLINIGGGTGNANGYRIAIDSNVTYLSTNPTFTINGVCAPQSSGNRGVPLVSYVAGQSNYVWATYLEASRTAPKVISLVDGSVHYPYKDDGYNIVVNTTNPPGNPNGLTNALFLGTVFGQGSSVALQSAPVGICQSGIQQFTTLIPKDSIITANYTDTSITPQKLKYAGQNFIFDGACFNTLVASCNITVPIKPLQPTSAASRRFAQYMGFGIAGSQTVFRPTYDNFYRIVNISIEGDIVGTITPVYDGLCNITSMQEVIDSYNVTHTFKYISQNGVSLVSAMQENGI